MGCTLSKDAAVKGADAAENKENLKIQKAQRKAAAEAGIKVEILILGTGDSGKTTLRKQLANVHNIMFDNEAYRKTFTSAIVSNLIEGAMAILEHLNRKGEMYHYLSEVIKQVPSYVDEKLAIMLGELFHTDEAIQAMIQKHDNTTIQLQDCWFVYAEELRNYPEWGGPQWIPNAEDCVRSRVRTSGVIKEELVMDGMPFLIYDVGGQRAERRKWLHMFDSVMSCIFVAALSEYDQVLFEDRSKNRMEEAFDLFSDVINFGWVADATTLLFLNKKDLFHQKYTVQKVPLNVSGRFPSAPEGTSDETKAIDWIQKQFVSKVTNNTNRIHVHVTTATDASNIRAVFKLAREAILGRNMAAAGFIK